MTQLIIIIFLIAVYNGFIINWKLNKDGKAAQWSRYWHFVGGLIRVFLAFCLLNFWDATAILLMHWLFYDMIINYLRGLDLFYSGSVQSGTGSLIDRLFTKKTILILKFVSLLCGITLLILT